MNIPADSPEKLAHRYRYIYIAARESDNVTVQRVKVRRRRAGKVGRRNYTRAAAELLLIHARGVSLAIIYSFDISLLGAPRLCDYRWLMTGGMGLFLVFFFFWIFAV